ncbi:MFS transporter [Streptacidiphilus jiangxiensis]|uniref:Predicted arabinose efflux permease, MFS family n=1 Tax=Streptacidiphilus jiangxiensis TaxID=235985 RepID=A0A1H7U4Y6_STRJI|nr:MFS transporter [Streptacidiphilus jiangxiensis]SEL92051.1 Predicted arabinose efflux permease, MFS family [Streptacidiphilus jiangxiensis]
MSDGKRGSLGRAFGWLWTAYAVSTMGTWLAFEAFPIVAIRALHVGAVEVSLLAAAGPAVGAALALPLGPWVEFRRKRPVMVAMDLIRFVVLVSLPLAYVFGWLSFGQLLFAQVVVGAADITFNAASGACLKALLPRADLLRANARFESTMWTSSVIGPPLGGAMIGMFGPVVTLLADAVSYLLSALGISAMRTSEPPPTRAAAPGLSRADLLAGWRFILGHRTMRPLFFNNLLVNGLIMASLPLLAVLMLGRLGFAPWQYALAFALPCLGGLLGSRLARPLVARYGRARVLRVSGVLRACWSLGLAFVGPGVAGLALVMVVEFGLITCSAVYNPVFATTRLELTPSDRVARTLSAWSVGTKGSVALMTGLGGLLAAAIGPRSVIALVGALMLATPLLLPRRAALHQHDPEPVPTAA